MREFYITEKLVCPGCGGSGKADLPAIGGANVGSTVCSDCVGGGYIAAQVPLAEAMAYLVSVLNKLGGAKTEDG